MLKKILFNIHWLVGITAGIVLAIVGLTGAMMSFEDEIIAALNGTTTHVASNGRTPLSLNELYAKIRENNPGRNIASLTVPSQEGDVVSVQFGGSGMSGPGGGPRGGEAIDPYTGEMIASATTGQERGREFLRSVEQLHRWLTLSGAGGPGGPPQQAGGRPNFGGANATGNEMGPMGFQPGQANEGSPGGPPAGGPPQRGAAREIGGQIQNWSVALLLVMALSGLYLRWPRRKALDWRSWLRINFKLKGFAFNWNLHAVIGTLVFVGYLFSAHSGLMMSDLRWYRSGFNAITGVKQDEERGPGGPGGEGFGGSNAVANDNSYDFNTLWTAFQREVPKFSSATLQLSRSTADEVRISYLTHKASGGESGRDTSTLVLNVDGTVKSHDRFSDKPLGERLSIRNFDIHSGNYFGLPGRIFMTFTSLCMPVLLVTGWMMYLARRKQKRARAAATAAMSAVANEG